MNGCPAHRRQRGGVAGTVFAVLFIAAGLAFGMIFPLAFGGAGAFVLVAMRRASRRQARREEWRTRFPDQPWMQFERWRSPELESESGRTKWLAIGFALFWNLVSAPVLFIVPRELSDGNRAALIALLVPLVGIGLIAWAVREAIRKHRYGDSRLRLDSVPVPLGGMLQATVDIPVRLEGRELAVQFACVHRYRTGTGKNRRTREKTLWEDRQRFAARSGDGPGRTSARIEMRLPGDRPVARDEDADDRIVWRLEVTSEEPGVDYKAVFELPVFDLGEADGSVGTEAGAPALPTPLFDADDWRETGVQHAYASGGQRFRFARLRMLGGGLMTLVFALVFGGAGAFLILGPGLWLFGGVFALVGLLILWAVVSMLFQQSEIVVSPDRLRWRHGVFGGWQEVEAGAIKAIGVKRSGSIGRNLYFRLELERWGREGRTAIAGWVPNERAARSLAAHLASLAGVRPEAAS
ncbi:MAG: hypothetical protein RQ847_05735 [Wenzhouxiangellaceae bacterium]|nr:hypothetical protein [Wenzhouxiangellaceae bacterium]